MYIEIENSPTIPGLKFRRFAGEADLQNILDVVNASKVVDKIERSDTLKDLSNFYQNMQNCDPTTDALFAEIDGQAVAYSRVVWNKEAQTGDHVYTSHGFMRPEVRRRGLGTAMLMENERRMREIAGSQPDEGEKFFASFAHADEVNTLALLDFANYQPVRYFFDMVRDLSLPVDISDLPEGLVYREVNPNDYRAIYDADDEAFSDHWGYSERPQEHYQKWLNHSRFQPELWKVAFAGEQVAGMVMNYIDQTENAEYRRKRGYTEEISVRRPWRKMGVARANLTHSLKMFQDMDMDEAALEVDADNPQGALKLYESVGFKVVHKSIDFRKPMKNEG